MKNLFLIGVLQKALKVFNISYNEKDENSSCWIRVSNDSVGAGFGSMLPPRVGQEVIITFIGGNPDKPIIVGRVYNDRQTVP